MTDDGPDSLADEFDEQIESLPASVDRAAVRRMRVAAVLLDDSIRVPGTDYHVGFDPILGLAPVVGDVLSGAFSLYIVAEAARLGVTPATLLHMIANVSVDVAVGSVPYVGDVVDAAWKANVRNLELVLADLAEQTALDEGTEIDIEAG